MIHGYPLSHDRQNISNLIDFQQANLFESGLVCLYRHKMLKDRLRQARKAAKMSQKLVAEAAGISQPAYSQLETDENASSRYLVNIARALNVSPNWLATGEGPMEPGVSEPAASYEAAGSPRARSRVRIRGTARLGDNGYYDETGADGSVDSYSPDPDAYALRVKGDSMHPAIRNGSIVVVEPNGRCTPTEYVAIALVDGRKMVKELVVERDAEIVVESVNGNHRQTIERANILQMYPVAAVVSPSKWRPE